MIDRLKRLTNLKILFSFSYKLKERVKRCCNNNKINPTPNSIAEKIKKKNVRDKRFKLSYNRPINKVMTYKVIHNNSAVKSRCSAVLVVLKKVLNNKKNNNIKVFKSPRNKIRIDYFQYLTSKLKRLKRKLKRCLGEITLYAELPFVIDLIRGRNEKVANTPYIKAI